MILEGDFLTPLDPPLSVGVKDTLCVFLNLCSRDQVRLGSLVFDLQSNDWTTSLTHIIQCTWLCLTQTQPCNNVQAMAVP